MGAQRPDAALDSSAPLQLVRAAAALRWKRPDLTVTLAELALDAADDAATWVAAAGWLLHGRTLLGDGRQVACDLLDGLGRWGEAGAELLGGPHGRRLRIELAGPARRAGEQAVARALLAADPGVEALDAELRADVLTELARCAVDEAPDTADAAVDAAEQAWLAAGCEPGVASVLLVRAARDRRAGRADAAVAAAVAGLARVDASDRRTDGSADHLAAALTAEWIAALVDAGRLDEARSAALPAAHRLLTTTRPSRQRAGLRLAVARVAAVGESTDTVLAALEPAAQDAADADVPELESACRAMLGELHEAAGRLDAALAALRAAMAAERCDHGRGARLRTGLATATATWAGRPSALGTARHPGPAVPPDALPRATAVDPEGGRADRSIPAADGDTGAGPGPDLPPLDPVFGPPPAPSDRAARARVRAGSWSGGATGPGRRARRVAAEGAAGQGWSDVPLPELGAPLAARSPRDPVPSAQHAVRADDSWWDDSRCDDAAARHAGDGVPRGARRDGRHGGRGEQRPVVVGDAAGAPAATAPPARAADTGPAVGSASLIGDALLRELIEQAGSRHAPAAEPERPAPAGPAAPAEFRVDVADTVVLERDHRHGCTVAVPSVGPPDASADGDGAGRSHRPDRSPDPGSAARAGAATRPGGRPGAPSRTEASGTGSSPIAGWTADPASAGSTAPGADTRPATHGDPGARNRAEGQPAGGSSAPGRPPAPADGDARPRATDPGGLGIGDLLAGALAAYRGM